MSLDNETPQHASETTIKTDANSIAIKKMKKALGRWGRGDKILNVFERVQEVSDVPHFVIRRSGVTYHYFSNDINNNTFVWEDSFSSPHALNGKDFPTHINLEKKRNETPLIAVTAAGEEELIPDLGLDRLRNDINKPELFEGELIGQGNEGKVYSYNIGGKHFAVKIYDEQTQQINQTTSMFGAHHGKPEFYERLMFGQKVVEALNSLPRNYVDFDGVKDYAASHNFHITELGPKYSLVEIMSALSKGSENRELLEFIKSQGITTENIKPIEEELNKIREVAFLLNYYGEQPFYMREIQTDLIDGNFLVRAYDKDNQRMSIVVIDQGQKRPMLDGHGRDMKDWDEMEKYSKLYPLLISDPQFSKFLKNKDLKAPNV